ncbi:WD40 repeat-like protein [Mytilinidion resinicola]|uniref:Elongator complex protein 2 n=1 Tax=Mytilinidion resinicola TaxID=574789 RepID=A0A6A6ZA95_9PEZI|nr:WD40 repeat-like protein [Mytilinidion resinicola]KAF2817205.1 WD40 repeat-like protein [Mytilinidion resinicola]
MDYISADFVSTGGNRHPSAADWDREGSQLLAFGADHNIALWNPEVLTRLLGGHEKQVTVVKFFPTRSSERTLLISGSADKTIRVWLRTQPNLDFELMKTVTDHQSALTRVAVCPGSDIFVSGASDGTVKVWKLIQNAEDAKTDVELLQSITLLPKYFPLSLALAKLNESSLILAAAGTRSTIQIFVSRENQFDLAATLTGHEGWVRSLEFTRESEEDSSDLLLASASQDKYIRLWRVHQGDELPAVSNAASDPSLRIMGKSLSNKAHRIESKDSRYSVTFEALLLGHEDWIYTALWRRQCGKLQLLTTSEDNSLAIWESDPASGVWVCVTRLGEISSQKGSTTATGSAGGFWIGLWSPDGDLVVSLGRTGSWRMWHYTESEDRWLQRVAISGHVEAVKGICWAKDGSYLLSTGSDQTTRLFAEWKRGSKRSWHEFSRPQIHGYDLNCIDSISATQFISGADEKLLRVFDKPRGVANLLNRLCDIGSDTNQTLPDAANIPVLGLSNKAIQAVEDEEPVAEEDDEREAVDPASIVRKSTLDLDHPPFEDHLARHLLWPESEKLYGHGYEISAVASSHDGSVIATACRASSLEHAVIRLYDTKEWLEIKPPLAAHSLTVTALEFAEDDQYLLSVGRDRQWAVFARTGASATEYKLAHSNPKGHSRMILDGSWAPNTSCRMFATAGRDKLVKLWRLSGAEIELCTSISATAAVTAVAFLHTILPGRLVLAYGDESGTVAICVISVEDPTKIKVSIVGNKFAPAKQVNQLAWRPAYQGAGHEETQELAIASEDSSVRILRVKIGSQP